MSDWVVLDITPLLFILPRGTHPGIPVIGLPSIAAHLVSLRELRFPVSHPILVFEISRSGRGEKVNMVGHDDVSPNKPDRRLSPNLLQQLMNIIMRQPWLTIFRADRIENDRGLTFDIKHTMSGMLALRQIRVDRLHGSSRGRGSRRAVVAMRISPFFKLSLQINR